MLENGIAAQKPVRRVHKTIAPWRSYAKKSKAEKLQEKKLITNTRTLVIKNGVAYGQAGAGVVYDSDPLSEYKETMAKMMGGLRAVFRSEAYGGVKVY